VPDTICTAWLVRPPALLIKTTGAVVSICGPTAKVDVRICIKIVQVRDAIAPSRILSGFRMSSLLKALIYLVPPSMLASSRESSSQDMEHLIHGFELLPIARTS
jgi:hypothetical protein